MTTPWRGIETLFGPGSLATFMRDVWPERMRVDHGPLQRLAPLPELPELNDLDALFGAPGVTSSAVELRRRTDFVQRSVSDDPAVAHELYQSGHTILVGDLHHAVPELGRMLELVVRQLGQPREGPLGEGRVTAYISPPGEALAPHFDRNVNFVVQLRGTKRWRVSRTPAVERTASVYYPSVPERAYDSLWRYADAETLSKGMPADCLEFDMVPGSVMYMPRGLWHATDALGPSWSLNFVLNQPTWLDVIHRALHDHLTASSEWRALALGLWSDEPATAGVARAELARMLESLREQVQQLSAGAMLVHARDVALYHPVVGAQLILEGEPVEAVRITSPELPDFRARVDSPQLALLHWLAQRRAPFWAREAHAIAPQLEPEAIDRTLILLLRHGYLRRRGFELEDGQLVRIV